MNYGIYLSAAGALSSMHHQDVLANNLANMNTVGFKPDSVNTRQRLPERLESPGHFADPKLMLERLGGGLFVHPTHVDVSPAELTETGNDLDLALDGDGMFVVESRGGGADRLRLTRDGRFTLNGRGELVMSASGNRVLDTSGRPIRLDPRATADFDADGSITQNGAVVAQLRVVPTPPAAALVKVGDNLMRMDDPAALGRRPAAGRVIQGYTETSGVDPIRTMNSMISAAKRAQANLKMMQYHDHLLGQAFNTYGRVA
jgi:flagellar basal body rod protein FlgG